MAEKKTLPKVDPTYAAIDEYLAENYLEGVDDMDMPPMDDEA